MFDINIWKELSLKLKRIKEREANMRRDICEEIIADNEMTNGRVTTKIVIDGYDVKAVQTLSYTLDVPALETIMPALSESEIACIVWKPTLSLALYKKLPEDSLLHEAIVTRLAMPTLDAQERGE